MRSHSHCTIKVSRNKKNLEIYIKVARPIAALFQVGTLETSNRWMLKSGDRPQFYNDIPRQIRNAFNVAQYGTYSIASTEDASILRTVGIERGVTFTTTDPVTADQIKAWMQYVGNTIKNLHTQFVKPLKITMKVEG